MAGHDARAAFIRVLGMWEYFGSGQLFVRWFPDLNWGYGGPVFNFYPPLFYFIAAAANVVLGHPALAINLTLFFLWWLSGVSMFFFIRNYWGGWAGLVSAVAYVYVPYHAVDVYTRGAYAEFTAFPLLPLILLSISKLSQTRRAAWLFMLAFSVAGLFLAHNATCLMFMPFVLLYGMIVVARTKVSRLRSGFMVLAGLVLGSGMAAFFWMPALLEKAALRTDFLLHGRYDFWKNFLDLSALFSWPLLPSSSSANHFDGIDFHIGGWHLMLAAWTILVLTVRPRKWSIVWPAVFFCLMASLALFMNLAWSRPVWDKLSLLHFLQFPWRFLVLVSFAISALAGVWLTALPSRKLKSLSAAFIVVLLVISGMHSVRLPVKEAVSAVPRNTQIFTSLFVGEGEYTPRWIMRPPAGPALERIALAMGQARVAQVSAPSKVESVFAVQASSPAILVANVFYFPGWHVYVDGKDSAITADPINGRIVFPVVPGEHRVRIKLELTKVQFWSIVISWAALVILLCCVWWFYKKRYA
ncbi:MAG: hypothetical protein HGA80_04535 [Candidatus Omnitrophica bacterium]|nr:hypothetical protein [Candidatus Omnitrophota bacterium]